MKNLACVVSSVLIFGFTVFGQTKKPNLVNTTWDVEYTLCGDSDYSNYATIKLLSAGKLSGSKGGIWNFVGNKITISNDREDYIASLTATLKGNVAKGKGSLGMNPREFCVRLVKK